MKNLVTLSLMLAAATASGCIVIDNSGNGWDDSSYGAPQITDVDVQAWYDTYYGECYWDFYAWVEDADGYWDVSSVSVDVVDMTWDYGAVVASFALAYDDYGQWSNTIYATYAGYADCNYPDAYAFDFWASDYTGLYDVVTLGGDVQVNSPPVIADALVEAGFDSYYGECFWDFYAWVDDWDGYDDVWSVDVSVVDLYYSPGTVVEIFPLAYDGGGQWSDTIYQTYAGYADCYYPDDYGFDFVAYDSYGDYSILSF